MKNRCAFQINILECMIDYCNIYGAIILYKWLNINFKLFGFEKNNEVLASST